VIYSNTLCTLVGILLGWWLLRWQGRKAGLQSIDVDVWLALCIVAAYICVVIGMWLHGSAPFVLQWTRWLRPRGDVYVAFGALALTTFLYARVRRIPCGTMANVGMPALLSFVVCARIGCFLHGCCWGDVCVDAVTLREQLDAATVARVCTLPWLCPSNWPLAVTFAPDTSAYMDQMLLGLLSPLQPRSLPCHPVQLYEAVLTAVLAGVLVWYQSRRPFPYSIACCGLGGYALIRLLLEVLRADHAAVCCGLTEAQLISIGCLFVAIVWYMCAYKSAQRNHQKSAA
jgi:phosphatidylglycerol:prolipoprotein diacylglycerol transferase